MNIKTALENNFKVTKEPLLKMALDRIEELEKSIQKKKFIIDQLNVQLEEVEKNQKEYVSCRIDCPVPVKNVWLGCSGRPIKYQKECPRLKEYKRRNLNDS